MVWLINLEIYMINFDEELARFKPSPEIEAAEELIHSQDLDDMADVIVKLMKEAENEARSVDSRR